MVNKPFTNNKLRREMTNLLLNLTGLNDLGHNKYLLEMLVDQYCLYTEAKREIEMNGFMITSETANGVVKKHNPAVNGMNMAADHYLRILKEFGLNPQQQSAFRAMLDSGKTPSSFDLELPE